ncbi:MAG TPA: acyltransferase, partial [Actinomycetota bacterium]|nr:acyltransferase [Actinomycetota bacterium]
MNGARIGTGVRIYGRVHIEGPLANLELGDRCTLNEGVLLNLRSRVTIGREARISSYVQIITASLELERVPREHVTAPIGIADGAWLAAGSVICAGVTVGRDAVVAAGAVVIHDVEARTLVGGVPATLIRRLTITDVRSALGS